MTRGRGDHPAWRDDLAAWFRDHAEPLDLDAGRLRIEEVPNPSGWYDNISCTVTDGATRLHVKLGTERGELCRSWDFRDVLAAHYRMPPILAWVELGSLAGICMPSIAGVAATEGLITEIVGVVNALHADRSLAAALPAQPATVRQAFIDLWIERWYADLDEVEAGAAMPPFLSRETFDWLRAETSRVADLTWDEAFDARAVNAVHNDLHFGNMLVEPDGRWWLLDWDDLCRGDPAMDLAILLAPQLERGESVQRHLGLRDHTFVDRFAVCARAVLLDGVIDSLADWVLADDAPSGADAIRAAKQAGHERTLAVYRARYGD